MINFVNEPGRPFPQLAESHRNDVQNIDTARFIPHFYFPFNSRPIPIFSHIPVPTLSPEK